MKDYFRLYVEPWIVISLAGLVIIGSFSGALWLGYDQKWELWPSAQAQDRGQVTMAFTVIAVPVPSKVNMKYPDEYQLASKDETDEVGFVKVYRRQPGALSQDTIGEFELTAVPELENRSGANGYKVRNWPIVMGQMIESVEHARWVEPRPDEKEIKVPKLFQSVTFVISSTVGGIHNDVTIFATDYDDPEKFTRNKEWILMDLDSALKLAELVEAGDNVTSTIQRPDIID